MASGLHTNLSGTRYSSSWTSCARRDATPLLADARQRSRPITERGASCHRPGRKRRLQPWTRNAGKRLVRSPKVYVRDSGIVHALLRIVDREQLLGHPVVGPSWEGLVIENLLAAAPAGASASFYRTSAGAEIDLLLELPAKGLWAIEVKRSISSPQPSKGFQIACEDIKATRRVVIYPGVERYRINAETEAVPLREILAEFTQL